MREGWSRRRTWGWLGLVLLLSATLLLAASPPWLPPGWRLAVYRVFSPVCHQLPARSAQVDGVPLALCHRCFGIYAGLLASALLFRVLARWDGILWRASRWIMLGVLCLLGVDWLLDVLAVRSNTPWSRTVTGLAFGAGAGYFLVRGVLELADTSRSSGVPDGRPESSRASIEREAGADGDAP